MQEQVILDTLRDYVNDRILQDPAVMIEPDTPLLEWGILNSVSTVQLIGFIRERFQVDVPPEEVAGRNFRDLRSITQLLAQLNAQRGGVSWQMSTSISESSAAGQPGLR